MERTRLCSHEVPPILRWLQRRGLAGNSTTRGIWEPVVIPKGVEVCWEHGRLHLGLRPGCRNKSPWGGAHNNEAQQIQIGAVIELLREK